jgi:hypothetical protein
MATEKEYDDEIAPLLKAVAERCQELGMAFVARVEFDGDDGVKSCGVTQVGNDDSSVAQRMAQMAAHCGGNFDALGIEMRKRFDCSSSILLSRI